MGLTEHRVIRTGLYIPIWWRDTNLEPPTPEQPQVEDDDPALLKIMQGESGEEVDHVNFMQAQPSESRHLESERSTVRLMGLHGLTGLVSVDPEMSITDQLEEVWPFQETNYDQVNTIYRVIEPLTYATAGPEQVYIVELQGDHFEQVHDDDVLTLVTIRFINTASHRNKLRVRVLWTPALSTRDFALDLSKRHSTLPHFHEW